MGTVARSSGRANGRARARPAGPPPPAIPPCPVRRFTPDEYHRLTEAGILTPDDRVELLHGWLVPKMTLHPSHAYVVNTLMRALLALVGPNRSVRVQQPITTPDSEPEPDLVVASGPDRDYKSRHPRASECLLVVEVAEASLRADQTTKLQLYAAARVGVYWVVNLVERRVEVYTRPRGGKSPGYRHRQDYGPGEAVPVVVAGRELGRLAVEELLP